MKRYLRWGISVVLSDRLDWFFFRSKVFDIKSCDRSTKHELLEYLSAFLYSVWWWRDVCSVYAHMFITAAWKYERWSAHGRDVSRLDDNNYINVKEWRHCVLAVSWSSISISFDLTCTYVCDGILQINFHPLPEQCIWLEISHA